MPRLSVPLPGMAKLYQQRPSWTRLQTNVKVCEVVFLFPTPPSFISWTALLDYQQLTVRENITIIFSTGGRLPVCEFQQNSQSFSSYAVVSDEMGKSGNRQPGCLKLDPSSCYFKLQLLSVGVSLLWVVPGKKWLTPPLPAEWQYWFWSSSSGLPVQLKRDLAILSSADGIKRMLCHSPLDYTDAS